MTNNANKQNFDPQILKELGRIDLIARNIFDGVQAGSGKSRRHGFSTEFSDFKAYTDGDDIRFLDWRLYARTDKLFVKRYEAETDREIIMLYDTSGSMAWRWKENISKLEYGTILLASLAYLYIRKNDQVGLLARDGNDLLFLPPRARRSHLETIFATLENIRPGQNNPMSALIHEAALMKRHKGQIIIYSDLEEEPEQIASALEMLSCKDDEIVLFHILDRTEMEFPFTNIDFLRDVETGEVLPVDAPAMKREHAETIAKFRSHWRALCEKHSILYIPIDTGTNFVDSILLMVNSRT